jgi:hypothetical protein
MVRSFAFRDHALSLVNICSNRVPCRVADLLTVERVFSRTILQYDKKQVPTRRLIEALSRSHHI